MNIFIQILWNMPMYLNYFYFATDLLLLCLQVLVVDIDCSLCNILILDADPYLPWIKWIFLFQSYRIALSVPLFSYFHSVCKFTVFNLNHWPLVMVFVCIREVDNISGNEWARTMGFYFSIYVKYFREASINFIICIYIYTSIHIYFDMDIDGCIYRCKFWNGSVKHYF